MKIIKYHLKTTVNTGTEEAPVWEDTPGPVCTMPDTPGNRAIAEAEAYGEIVQDDDGQPETVAEPSEEDVTLDLLADHEYRLCMLELGGETL